MERLKALSWLRHPWRGVTTCPIQNCLLLYLHLSVWIREPSESFLHSPPNHSKSLSFDQEVIFSLAGLFGTSSAFPEHATRKE